MDEKILEYNDKTYCWKESRKTKLFGLLQHKQIELVTPTSDEYRDIEMDETGIRVRHIEVLSVKQRRRIIKEFNKVYCKVMGVKKIKEMKT